MCRRNRTWAAWRTSKAPAARIQRRPSARSRSASSRLMIFVRVSMDGKGNKLAGFGYHHAGFNARHATVINGAFPMLARTALDRLADHTGPGGRGTGGVRI